MTAAVAGLLDPRTLIAAFGTAGVVLAVFAETGLFFGFFLPGDSLLFTAGFLSSQGYLPMGWLLLGSFVAAVVGDSLGYAFGRRIGPAIFTRQGSFMFDPGYIARAEHFYEKHGNKTVILARFMPIVRTFAPIVAGVGSMKYGRFLAYNLLGGLLWTGLMLGLGYGFGSVIPDPDRLVLPAVGAVILLSALPALRSMLKNRP
ncbi:MAG: DedA family protein [Cyanobacteria bacterium REEB65]|nr:DedA family protein [Cyanobacteria bacterium REEB65]